MDDKGNVIFNDIKNGKRTEPIIFSDIEMKNDLNIEIDLIRKDNERKERLNQTYYDTSAIVDSLNNDKIYNSESNI